MSTSTIIPRGLKKGDTVALVAPSSRLNAIFPLRIARATAWLEAAGYKVKDFYDEKVPSSPRSANVAGRVEELHAAFRDPAVRAVVCVIGGLSNNELLPHLDPEIIRANPKIFIGSSDTTLLHHFCYAAAGLRTFYGPSALTQLAEYPRPHDFTWWHFTHVLCPSETENARPIGALPRSAEFTDDFCPWEDEGTMLSAGTLEARPLRSARGWRWLRPGKAQAVLWGGCLPSMLQLFGTRWEVGYEGKIALIELPEGDEPGVGLPLERAIWHLNDLRLKGVWDQIVGLVVGRPYRYSREQEEEWEAAILHVTEGYSWPILAGVDVGHTDPMLTIPLGAEVRLDSKADSWEMLGPGVVVS